MIVSVSRGVCQDLTEQVFARIAENWSWSQYWFGKTGIDDAYVEGKQISALIFWNENENRPIRGLCSTELSLCVAYSGVYLDPFERKMQIAPNTTPQEALTSFIHLGMRDSSHILAVEGLTPADFRVEQKSITLPTLKPPSSILRREIPQDAARAAEKVRLLFGCWGVEIETRPQSCGGNLVFAFYGERDPYWFVLRSCSKTCEFKGESVEMLRRGDHGWEVTSGGFVGSPKTVVERLKQQIERAEMFRIGL